MFTLLIRFCNTIGSIQGSFIRRAPKSDHGGSEEHRGRPVTGRPQESLEIEKLSYRSSTVLGVVCGLRKEYTTLGKWLKA